jgi:alpha-ketoglutarate-dependent 2,4-dichlorophenoxyacetate dioxygenase
MDAGNTTRAYSDTQKKRLTVVYALVRSDPMNGRGSLYVGSHAQEVVGMSLADGATLTDELTALRTQPPFVYSHPWRVHDLVIWDNRSVLQRATTFHKTKYRRKLHRTTAGGLAPDSAFARMPEAVAA